MMCELSLCLKKRTLAYQSSDKNYNFANTL